MASKRQRREADTPTGIPTPDTPDAAMAVIRHLMKQFSSVDPAMLEDESRRLRSVSILYVLESGVLTR